MTEVNVDRNLYLNTQKTYTDENGNEQFGVYESAFRDPETHRIRFDEASTVKADEPLVDEASDVSGEQVTVTKDEEVHPSAVQTPSDFNPAQVEAPAEAPEENA